MSDLLRSDLLRSDLLRSDLLVRIAWFGLGNLTIAIPMAALAWWSSRSGRPALTHALWVLVLLKLATPPLGYVPFDFGQVAEMPIGGGEPAFPIAPLPSEAPIAPLPAVAESATPIDWLALLGTAACSLWLVGTLVVFGWALARLVRFRRLLGLATPAPGTIVVEATRLAEALGVSCPRIVLLPGAISPLLWVGWRAYLVVPVELLQRLDGQQRTALLLHELAHWRRGDHWVRRLEAVVLALYWWCPLVWWAKAQLQQAEEECCDAWVIATVPEAVRAYALALVETVDFLSGDASALPPLASGLGPLTSLRRRLTMMFRNPMPRMLTAPGLCGLGLVAALCLSWSPMPASVLAQDSPRGSRKPAPPADDDAGDAPREGSRSKARDPKDLQREVERLEKEIAETVRELQDVKDKARRKDRDERQEGGRQERKQDRAKGEREEVDALEMAIQKQRVEAEKARADAARARALAERGAFDRARMVAEKALAEREAVDRARMVAEKAKLTRSEDAKEKERGENRSDLEKRMSEVERKLDTILWQLTEIRRASAGQSGAGTPPPPPPPPAPPTVSPGRRGPRSGVAPKSTPPIVGASDPLPPSGLPSPPFAVRGQRSSGDPSLTPPIGSAPPSGLPLAEPNADRRPLRRPRSGEEALPAPKRERQE
jgi:beta-lactamase regulating signal transducer with metallopeptidase domain